MPSPPSDGTGIPPDAGAGTPDKPQAKPEFLTTALGGHAMPPNHQQDPPLDIDARRLAAVARIRPDLVVTDENGACIDVTRQVAVGQSPDGRWYVRVCDKPGNDPGKRVLSYHVENYDGTIESDDGYVERINARWHSPQEHAPTPPTHNAARTHSAPPRSTRQRTRSRESHSGQRGHRRTSRTSAASSGDDGSGSPSDSDPPAEPRTCAAPWCDHPVHSARASYCSTERCQRARAEERQRKHRNEIAADWVAELFRRRLEDARAAHYIGSDAFGDPDEHALSFLWRFGLADGQDPGEFEAIRGGYAAVCSCNGHHIDGGAVGCLKCGKPRPALAGVVA